MYISYKDNYIAESDKITVPLFPKTFQAKETTHNLCLFNKLLKNQLLM